MLIVVFHDAFTLDAWLSFVKPFACSSLSGNGDVGAVSDADDEDSDVRLLVLSDSFDESCRFELESYISLSANKNQI